MVQTLMGTLPYSASFVKVDNKWKKPQLSTRKVKELERAAIFHNIPYDPSIFTLYKKPATEYTKHGFIKPFKGRKSAEKNHDARLDKIVDALKTMRPKMEKLRLEEQQRRSKDFYDLGQFGKGIKNAKGRGMMYQANANKKKKDSKNVKKKKK